MKHFMKLLPTPFEQIRSGRKTIEMRLYDEKRQLVKIGDEITFTNLGNESETITAKVTALHIFDSFKELYGSLPMTKCGYSPSDTPSYTDMEKIYPKEKQEKYGVIGIEIVLTDTAE